MAKATVDELATLHELLANTLATAIKTGEANAGMLNVARQFLKDNNIDSQAEAMSPLALLKDAALPFDDNVTPLKRNVV